jgi:hypothetical protein
MTAFASLWGAQRPPVSGYALTLRAVFEKERVEGLAKELRLGSGIRSVFNKGLSNARPVTEAVEVLEPRFPHTSQAIAALSMISEAGANNLPFVAIYDTTHTAYEPPTRSELGRRALRMTAVLSGTTVFRTGGMDILGHRFGRHETATPGDVFVSNETDLEDIPLISIPQARGERVHIDFLEAPGAVPRFRIPSYLTKAATTHDPFNPM